MRTFRLHSVLPMILVVLTPIAGAAQNRDPAKTPVVYSVPGMSRAVVRSGVVFDDSPALPLAFDAYVPRGLRKGERRPAIVFISGGERVRHWRWFITLGQLAAAHGMIGIVPDKRYPRGFEGTRAGFEDTHKLLAFLKTQGEKVGVDRQRICLWTFSAGGRLTSVGLQADKSDGSKVLPGTVRCLVSFYGVLDMSGELSSVSNDADREKLLKHYSPVQALESLVASGGNSPPMFIARAGKDSAFINNGIDRFTSTALRLNAPITVVNYADGDHGFDGINDTSQSRAIIKAAFRFVQEQSAAR
ncbi:MAG TPA: alpha/beta hydrolase [Blastocatellia bacterium]|nr:alpha/beta hydrolase [Blastocatellia bacterium]